MLEKLNELIKPIVDELGYELYFIDYVKEDGEYYLRVYIDDEKGITLEDCEKVSRPISDMLDIEDPITDAYYLEVSSPGIYRTLFNDLHLKKYVGYEVCAKLKSSINGNKQIRGELTNFNEDIIVIKQDKSLIEINRDKIKSINLEGSFKEGNQNE
ncbi:ribosome maturation factor RimP [Clostridium sp. 19966]|uniref:ribosome maturation factor RimP n=1 Tax=Clostridium sp. 19966 TaxID=2768166 RepID=UPI0028DF6030|nr:ribosome maturation factor RimP [Clostridium sp. 19966]MDT8716423.1 ribosome maturation factor RimP [Clostridium sp. 19966]